MWSDGKFQNLPWVGDSSGGTPAPPPSRLLTGLVSYWKFDEVSGTRFDSLGINDLTDLGAGSVPGSTPGIIGNAVTFDGTSRVGTGGPLNPPGSFTIAGWFNINFTSFDFIWGQQTSSLSFWLVNFFGTFQFKVSANGATVTALNNSLPTSGVTVFIACWYDNSSHQIGASFNAGTPNTTAFTGPVFSNSDPFAFGDAGTSAASGMIGWQDETGYWSRVLASDELTELYNAGVGITYPFTGMQTIRPASVPAAPIDMSLVMPVPNRLKRFIYGVVAATAVIAAALVIAKLLWF